MQTIQFYHAFFFLIIDLCILSIAVVAKMFNSTAELAVPIGIPINKAKVEIKAHPDTAKTKTSDCSI